MVRSFGVDHKPSKTNFKKINVSGNINCNTLSAYNSIRTSAAIASWVVSTYSTGSISADGAAWIVGDLTVNNISATGSISCNNISALGVVSIGKNATLDSGKLLYINDSSNIDASGFVAGVYQNLVNSGGGANLVGIYGYTADYRNAGTRTNLIAANPNVYKLGSSNLIWIAGTDSAVVFGGAGNVTSAAGLNVTFLEAGAEVITNAYGLRINNLPTATNKYAIYTGTGSCYFGDNTNIAGDLIVKNISATGSISAEGLSANAWANIGNAATAGALTVTGTGNITGNLTADSISATSNLTVDNISANNNISATGHILGKKQLIIRDQPANVYDEKYGIYVDYSTGYDNGSTGIYLNWEASGSDIDNESVRGLDINARLSAGNAGILYGIDLLTHHRHNSSGNRVFGIYNRLDLEATALSAYGFYHTPGTQKLSAAKNYYGVYLDSMTHATTNAGWDSRYGLYIEDIANASANNYAIYTGLGGVRFGDTVSAADLQLSGDITLFRLWEFVRANSAAW